MADIAHQIVHILSQNHIQLDNTLKYKLWVFLLRTTSEGKKVVKFLMENVDKFSETEDNSYIQRNRCVVLGCGKIMNIPVSTHASFLILFRKNLFDPIWEGVLSVIRTHFEAFDQDFIFLEKVSLT